jgi:hypothetical protein
MAALYLECGLVGFGLLLMVAAFREIRAERRVVPVRTSRDPKAGAAHQPRF